MRELSPELKFGRARDRFGPRDFILIKGAGYKDGIYQVRDTMNSKWVNMVDILESTHVKPYKFADAHIYKMPWLD